MAARGEGRQWKSYLGESYPHIIGDDAMAGSFIRALDEGGLMWESERTYATLDDAFQDLETALAAWMGE